MRDGDGKGGWDNSRKGCDSQAGTFPFNSVATGELGEVWYQEDPSARGTGMWCVWETGREEAPASPDDNAGARALPEAVDSEEEQGRRSVGIRRKAHSF